MDGPTQSVTRLALVVEIRVEDVVGLAWRELECRGCGDRFTVCRRCEGPLCPTCAGAERKRAIRAASRRYQATEKGRANHAARQQMYLIRRAAKMTQQHSAEGGSQATFPETSESPATPVLEGADGGDDAQAMGGHVLPETEALVSGVVPGLWCARCGRVLDPRDGPG